MTEFIFLAIGPIRRCRHIDPAIQTAIQTFDWTRCALDCTMDIDLNGMGLLVAFCAIQCIHYISLLHKIMA